MEPSCKFTVICLALLFIGLCSATVIDTIEELDTDSDSSYPELWFDQRLDQLSYFDSRTFKQRYMMNDAFYDEDQGIGFLLIGGHKAISGKLMESKTITELVKRHKGILFQLEHRYYGKSLPSDDKTCAKPTYLSAEQAILDTITFMNKMSYRYEIYNWIAIGESYAGYLATRLKAMFYVTGAVIVSAPVVPKVDFYEYYYLVEEAIFSRNRTCYMQIGEAFKEFESLIETADGKRNLESKISLEELQDSDMLPFLSLAARHVFARGLKYNRNNVSEYGIDYYCSIMNDQANPPMDNLLNLIEKEYHHQTNLTSDSYMWHFQKCNEFGYFKTSSFNSVFGNHASLDSLIQSCSVFGCGFDKQSIFVKVGDTNENFREVHLKYLSNIVSYQGSLDPWRLPGSPLYVNPNIPIITVEGASHGQILRDPLEGEVEPEGLDEARESIYDLVGTWLEPWLPMYKK